MNLSSLKNKHVTNSANSAKPLTALSMLSSLKDQDLLRQTKELVKRERQLLTQVLHHLREVERRKLFSDLGYPSLFEYAVQELKYSEGQAGRRIQAMRLLKELPDLESKIESGALSLSNICQAQSFFREKEKSRKSVLELEVQKLGVQEKGAHVHAQVRNQAQNSSGVSQNPLGSKLSAQEKLEVLQSLENCSAREGQKKLVKLEPALARPKERERVIAEDLTQVSFVVSEELKGKLEEVRSLLGHKAVGLGWAELVGAMAELSLVSLREKRFGKKGARETEGAQQMTLVVNGPEGGADDSNGAEGPKGVDGARVSGSAGEWSLAQPSRTGKAKTKRVRCGGAPTRTAAPTSELARGAESKVGKIGLRRRVPREVQRQVWRRDEGRCQNCGMQRGLELDHIKPVALGGSSGAENLRLLCRPCNQREAVKVFGVKKITRMVERLGVREWESEGMEEGVRDCGNE